MNHVTVTSETKLISTNGDGPVVMENAATLYAALSALGAVPIVEIVIRTQPPPAVRRYINGEFDSLPEPASAANGYGGLTDPEPEPPVTVPTPPPPPVAGAWSELDILFADLDAGTLSWRRITHDQRKEAALRYLNGLYVRLGHAPTQAEYHAHKPDWMPSATPLTALFKMTWADLMATCRPS